jgi:SAM-dependent methyltransferase
VVSDVNHLPTADAAAWAAREADHAQAYDAIGLHYDKAFPHKEGQVECVRRLLAELGPGARVLDLGCGTGVPTARELVAAGCQVTGVDISPDMLHSARRNVPEADFRLLDMVDLDPAPDQYEAVVAFFSLLNLPREQIREVLRLAHGIIAPGGLFGFAMVEADVDDTPITFLGERIRVSGYPRYELRTLLVECGYTAEWEQVLSYAPATLQAPPEVQIFGLSRRVG